MSFKWFFNAFLLLHALQHVLSDDTCTSVAVNARIDCAPDRPNDRKSCEDRKCCFSDKTDEPKHAPKCFFSSDFIGYEVISIQNSSTNQIEATLARKTPSGFPKDVQSLALKVTSLTNQSLRIRITDAKNTRYESPLPRVKTEVGSDLKPLFEISIEKNGSLEIRRKATETQIFATDLSKLVFADQFIQLKTKLSSNLIYGLGEHKTPFLKSVEWQLLTFFNRDTFPNEENFNLYGSHPFYLNVENTNDGNANGVYLLNSNAMDILLQPEPALTWRPIGGVLDLFIFLGPSAEEVVNQYVQLIGKPVLPPFWSLGYHQCRCCPSPHTLEEQKGVTERTLEAEIPFDVQWNAKEYMIAFNDFTIDEKVFKGFGQWVEELHSRGMRYVPIIDPGIDPTQPRGSYSPFDDGMEMNCFIKNSSDQNLVGKVWNKSGKTVWPDFSHPNATEYWTKQNKEFHQKVAIDGSWNDMNEISNFVDGSLDGCPKNSLEDPPYVPGGHALHQKTLCMSAQQWAGRHYDVHNLYAHFMAISTYEALKEVRGKRPFIISRASSPGLGSVSGHWDGDTFSTWDQLAWTIPSIMNFNLFGVPLVGADICGFQGNAKNDSAFQELCARWLQVGAFYPFARNHNTKKVDQDPVALGSTVVRAARNALRLRYSLLPYLYTLFYRAHAHGHTVVRPLFFEFPNDLEAYSQFSESEFLWGSALLVIPVLSANQTRVKAYVPKGKWFPFSEQLEDKPLTSGSGQLMEMEAPIDKINLLVRGGHVIPLLPPKVTTEEMRKQNFTLLVALDDQSMATGQLYWDDGDSLDTIEGKKYSLVEFKTRNGSLSLEPKAKNFKGKTILNSIVVLGLKKKPEEVSVNGNKHQDVKYEEKIEKLVINELNLSLFESLNEIQWN